MSLGKPWTVSSASGGRYPAIDPVFFPSNKNQIAIATALAVKIYQINTKQVIAKVPVDCTGSVQMLLAKDEQSFFIVYENGTVRQVELTGEGTNKILPLSNRVIRILSVDDKNNIQALYHAENHTMSLGTMGQQTSKAWFTTKKSALYAFSNNAEYISVVHQGKKESTIETFHVSTKTTTEYTRTRPSASVAISNKGLVAIGAPSGVIDIYYSEGIRSLKWHLAEVSSLHFSLQDNYLISGGAERVLVFWQMDADKQQFLPRLDGTVTRISSNANSTLYAITLDDAQVLILNAIDLLTRLQVSGLRAHFAKSPIGPEKEKKRRLKNQSEPLNDYSTLYRIHPSTRNAYFVCPQQEGKSGSQIQIYNPVKDEQEAVVNLAPTITAGKVRSEQRILDPSVSHLEFTADGQWMITVDVATAPPIDSLESRNEVSTTLKFWKLADANWTLVTKITEPHGQSIVADVAAHPRDHSFITASRNGNVRLWRYDTKLAQWTLRRSVPHGTNDTKAVAVAWSNDASTVALGFETGLTLLDGVKWAVHSTLSNVLGSRVRGLWFVGKYLVALAKDRLVVWDIVLAKKAWSIQVNVPINAGRLVAVDPASNHIAIAVNFLTSKYHLQSRIALFHVTSPIPVASVNHAHGISSVQLIPGTAGFSFVDVHGVISTVGSSASASSAPGQTETVAVSLFNQTEQEDEMIDEEETTQRLGINSFDHVFTDGASLETLFERVMRVVG